MPWQVLTGVLEWWADQGLLNIGRRRFHKAQGRMAFEGATSTAGIELMRFAFAARRVPWRLTAVSLGAPDDKGPPAVVSWADDATAVLKGNPAESQLVGPNYPSGSWGLRRMLEPGKLETLIPKPWPARFELAGHLLEQDMFLLPEFVSLASDSYEVTYGAELDILTMWAAIIDGDVAQRISLEHVASMDLTPAADLA